MAETKTANKQTKVEEEEKVSMTAADFNNIISSAVNSAVQAALANQQPTRSVVNEAASIGMERRLAEESLRFNRFYKKLAEESDKRVPIEIPEIFAAHIGPNLTVTLNGSTVKIPVNGQTYMIHEAFKPIIDEKLRHVSRKVSKANHHNYKTNQTGDILEMS